MQKNFRSVEDLLKRLYTERKLLNEMFSQRKNYAFHYDDAREFAEKESNIQLLIDYGVLRQEGDTLEIEELYLQFLEEVLQVNEVISKATVTEHVEQLKDNIDYYFKETNNPAAQRTYLQKIKRSIRNIGVMASQNVVDLKRNVNDTFKHERNYQIKKEKLVKYREKIADIANLVQETENLLDNQQESLALKIHDEQLFNIIQDVRINLRDVYHNLIDLEKTIRDYLHQIEAQNQIIKRVRKLKYLREQMLLSASTNVREVLDTLNPVCWEPRNMYSIKPSITYLQNSDEGLELLKNIQQKIKKKQLRNTQEVPPITENQLNAVPQIVDFVDIDALSRSFLASNQNLFDFVMNYPYNTEQTFEQKVEYYTEVIQNNFNKLHFTNDWRTFNNVQYPMIYAKTK